MQPAPESTELVISRSFDATPERLFLALTDTFQFAKWRGPAGFEVIWCNISRRERNYLYCIESAEGQRHWSAGDYLEVIPLEKIVCTEYSSNEDGHHLTRPDAGLHADWPDPATIIITITPDAAQTRLTVRTGVPEHIAATVQTAAGWNESFDKLAAYLDSEEPRP